MQAEISELTSQLARARAEIARLRDTNIDLSLSMSELQESQAILDRNRQLEQEMQLASQIQTSILPKQLSTKGLEIATRMVPAALVGGDYYDLQPAHDGCWIGIGDVSGHGVTAGLVMMMTQSVIAAVGRARPDASPRDVLALVNDVIYDNIHRRLQIREFVTLSLLRFQHDNPTVTLAGAHEDIVIVRADGSVECVETPGIWLGQKQDIRAATVETHFDLALDDMFVLYTDGITEARDRNNKQFGLERLKAVVVSARHDSLDDICTKVLDAVSDWSVVQDDDRTLVIGRRSNGG